MKYALLLSFLLLPLSFAGEKPVNQTRKGIAIKGYDPVAYFTTATPTRGSVAYQTEYEGAVWHFANRDHLARFKENPAAFVPQFGGYCAYAVSQNSLADIDPEAWKIVDGKLYLNYSARIQRKWEKKQAAYLKAGHENWPGVLKR